MKSDKPNTVVIVILAAIVLMGAIHFPGAILPMFAAFWLGVAFCYWVPDPDDSRTRTSTEPQQSARSKP